MLHRFTPGQNGHRKLGIGRKNEKLVRFKKSLGLGPETSKQVDYWTSPNMRQHRGCVDFITPSGLSTHKHIESEHSVCPANALKNI